MKTALITGAAGFIGSAFVRIMKDKGYRLVILDALTYAGHLENLEDVLGEDVEFVEGNICDYDLVAKLLSEHKVGRVVNFAAESHVDNSISGPKAFIETNVMGTFALLEASRAHWKSHSDFRFLHVSTDEVFGSLGPEGKFRETTPYAPNSPYSASKAGSDHLVRAWFHTYGLPCVTTNCSNNYGPRQFPEKLIPRMIFCALSGETLPVYGDGSNIRDWIHVEDHAAGILLALENGELGETYCFGGNSERTNLQVVETICQVLDELKPRHSGSYKEQIGFVEDRLGHDFRYAIDDTKAIEKLGYTRRYQNFESGLRATVEWYLKNYEWADRVTKKSKG